MWRDFWLGLLFRFLLASPLLGVAGWFLLIPDTVDLMDLLCALPFMLGATLVLSRPFLELGSELFMACFYGGRREQRPLPMYGIPQSRRARGLYEEAMVEYEKIAAQYPDEVQPHIGRVEIAALDLHDPARAESVFRHGMDVLRREEDRAVLKQMYESITSRLHAKPDWLIEEQARVLRPEKIEASEVGIEPDGVTASRYHSGGRLGPGHVGGADGFVDHRPRVKRRAGEKE